MIFFISFLLSLILYTYFGYLFFVVVLGKLRNRRVKKTEIYPSVALMISAYNEEQGIEDKLVNSLELDYPKNKLKIIVVSDASSDRTDEIVKSYQTQGIELIRIEGRVGKTAARNEALKKIDDEIIIFSDATTIYEKNVIHKLVCNFSDVSVGMVTGQLRYTDGASTQMGFGQRLFWWYESVIKKSQTRMGTLTGSVGCMTAFRRSLYTELPSNIIEDFTGPLMIIKKGFRVVYEEEAVCYEETTKKSSNEWKMRVRVIQKGMTGMWYAREILNPLKYPLVSFQLFSHKILRWFIPVICSTLLLLSVLEIILQAPNIYILGFLNLQILFYLLALTAFIMERYGIHNRALGIMLYFSVVNAAAFVALVKTLSADLEPTWETQRELKTEVNNGTIDSKTAKGKELL